MARGQGVLDLIRGRRAYSLPYRLVLEYPKCTAQVKKARGAYPRPCVHTTGPVASSTQIQMRMHPVRQTQNAYAPRYAY